MTVNKFMFTSPNDKAARNKGNTMKINTLKITIASFIFGLIALLGTGGIASAQNTKQEQRQQQKIAKQEREAQKRMIQNEDRQIKMSQRSEQNRLRNLRRQNAENNRYRIMRDGAYYQTDTRGVDLLKQAVNSGYQEGYRAGRNDRYRRRTSSYNNSTVYRKGNYGYQSYVDSKQYQYYFKQGFERGYDDSFNSRSENGTNTNGSINILESILQNILTFERY